MKPEQEIRTFLCSLKLMREEAKRQDDEISVHTFERIEEAVRWILDDPSLDTTIISCIEKAIENTKRLEKIARSAEYN